MNPPEPSADSKLLYPYRDKEATYDLFARQQRFLDKYHPGASFVPTPKQMEPHHRIRESSHAPYIIRGNPSVQEAYDRFVLMIKYKILDGLKENSRHGLTFGSEKEHHIVDSQLEPGSCIALFKRFKERFNGKHSLVEGDCGIPIEILIPEMMRYGFVPGFKPDGGAQMLEIASAPHSSLTELFVELGELYSRLRTVMSDLDLHVLGISKHPLYHMLPWAEGKSRYPEIVHGLESLGYSLYPASTHTGEQMTFGIGDEETYRKTIAALGWAGVYMTPLFSNSLDVDENGHALLDDRATMWCKFGTDRTGLTPYFKSLEELIWWWFTRTCILYKDEKGKLTANTHKTSFGEIVNSQKEIMDEERLYDLLAWHIGTIWTDTRAKVNGLVEFRTPSSGNPLEGEPMLAFSLGMVRKINEVFDFLGTKIGEARIRDDYDTVMNASDRYPEHVWQITARLLDIAEEGLRELGEDTEQLSAYRRRLRDRTSLSMNQLTALKKASELGDISYYHDWLTKNRLHSFH